MLIIVRQSFRVSYTYHVKFGLIFSQGCFEKTSLRIKKRRCNFATNSNKYKCNHKVKLNAIFEMMCQRAWWCHYGFTIFAPATLVAQIAIWIRYIALAVSTSTIGFPNDCWWFKHKSFVCKANRSLSIKHNTICGHNFILHPLFIDHVKETFNGVHLMRKYINNKKDEFKLESEKNINFIFKMQTLNLLYLFWCNHTWQKLFLLSIEYGHIMI